MTDELPCACTALRKASRAVSRLYDDALAVHGLTVTQFAILRNIERLGGPVLSALAETLVMDRTSLYRTLEPMQRAGWIEIAAAARGRAKLARLTPAGRALMAAAAGDWAAAQARVVEGFGAEAWAAMNAGLARVVEIAAA